jgi:predicted nucleotidyltransferase
VIGSRAYGLDTEASDVDRRGFFLPPADVFWSLDGVPEQIEKDETQECYWEVGKFLRLALKANPQVLECLNTPIVEHATPLVRELLDMRGAFLSKEIARTCDAYALSQFNKVSHELRTKGSIKWKHAMHLVRILLLGLSALEECEIRVEVGEHKEKLLAIRKGELPWTEVDRWRKELHEQYAPALETTRLPEHPDKARVEAWLVKARRSVL